MKFMNFKTDMADERVDEYKKRHNLSEIDGIEIVTDDSLKFAKVVTVEITNENGKKALDKEIGKYITIECKDINYLEEEEEKALVQKIKEVVDKLIDNPKASIMVVGLGNYEVTPDALGARVTSKMDITRHIIKFASQFIEEGAREISSITPGVLGTTGIESAEIIESVARKVNPDVIIVIDSLMSQSMNRLGKTIQITDRGIVPGAGIGNTRKAVDENSMNVKVIALGVPLVVEAATIVSECLNIIEEKEINNNYESIKEKLNINEANMIVVPKDIDELVDNLSIIISKSINELKYIEDK